MARYNMQDVVWFGVVTYGIGYGEVRFKGVGSIRTVWCGLMRCGAVRCKRDTVSQCTVWYGMIRDSPAQHGTSACDTVLNGLVLSQKFDDAAFFGTG